MIQAPNAPSCALFNSSNVSSNQSQLECSINDIAFRFGTCQCISAICAADLRPAKAAIFESGGVAGHPYTVATVLGTSQLYFKTKVKP